MITKRLLLEFTVDVVNKPVTCQLIKNYNVDVNILNANINYNQNGRLILDISGEDSDIERATEYLGQNTVICKVLSNSVTHNEEKCVNCGACSGICPTQAFSLDPKLAQISYSNDKCILCKLCIKACPLRAISIEEWD